MNNAYAYGYGLGMAFDASWKVHFMAPGVGHPTLVTKSVTALTGPEAEEKAKALMPKGGKGYDLYKVERE